MPKNYTRAGKKGAVRQLPRYGRDESGFYSVEVYKGTVAEVKARAAGYDAAGAQYEVEDMNGGQAQLSVRTGWANSNQLGQEIPVDVWELDPQEVEKDLLDADFPHSEVFDEPIPAADRTFLTKAIESPDASVEFLGQSDTHPQIDGEIITITRPDLVYPMYRLMRSGVRSFPVEASVIRHSQLVSNRYTVKASFTNCGRIFSNATFISSEGVPSDLLFDVPASPTVIQFIEEAGDLAYGWRKLRPSIQRLALQRWQITNNYQFGLWTVKTYGPVL